MIRNFQYKTFVAIVLIFAAFHLNAQSERTYKIKVTEKGVGTKDGELYLKNNAISATFSKETGFPEATYVLAQDSTTQRNVQTFTAECTNAKKHTLKWSGKIDGVNVQGKAQHFYFGTLAGEYLFNGSLK